MYRHHLILLAALGAANVLGSQAWAQAAAFAAQRVTATGTIKTAVQANDIPTAATTTLTNCSTEKLSAKPESDWTVDEQHAQAAHNVRCLEELRSVMIAAAAGDPNPQRAAVKVAAAKEAIEPHVKAAQETKDIKESEQDFMGMKWSLGFGMSYSEDDVVDDAQIVNGVVRAKSAKQELPRVVLEYHKIFWCNKGGKEGTRGCGPFIAVSATQDKVLSGVGVGLFYAMKTKPTDAEGYVIGLGGILDGKVRSLADGFEENQPPPAGETEVRYKEEARWSALLFVSRTFSF
jgi:hypothetical protein